MRHYLLNFNNFLFGHHSIHPSLYFHHFWNLNNPINNSITKFSSLHNSLNHHFNWHMLFFNHLNFLNHCLIVWLLFDQYFCFLFDKWLILISFNFDNVGIWLYYNRNYFFPLSINFHNLFTDMLNWNKLLLLNLDGNFDLHWNYELFVQVD